MNKVLYFAMMVLLWSGVATPARGFELHDILSAPYADELISASNSERIAWVVYEAGVRNIWTAAAPSFEPQRLTDFECGRRSAHRRSGVHFGRRPAVF